MKPHKHQETIIAWAAGEKVEWSDDGVTWVALGKGCPLWDAAEFWRVKPAEPEKVYPRTRMTREELSDAWNRGPDESFIRTVEYVANAALRHACDNGQVVTRKEFDRAVGDRKARDLAIADAFNTAASNFGVAFSHTALEQIINGVKQ